MGLFAQMDIEKRKAKRDVKGLLKALNHTDGWRIPLAAVRALGEVGDSRAAEALNKIVVKNEYWGMRMAAAEALGNISSGNSVETLVGALRDEHWSVRRASAQALEKMGWEPDNENTRAAYLAAKHQWDRHPDRSEPRGLNRHQP